MAMYRAKSAWPIFFGVGMKDLKRCTGGLVGAGKKWLIWFESRKGPLGNGGGIFICI